MRSTVVVALCLAALLASPALAREPGPDLEAKVVRVVDGDTIKVRLLGRMPRCFRAQAVRLRHCDTPELRDNRPEIAAKAREAKAYVAERITPGMRLTLRDVGRDKYGGRMVVDVEIAGENLCRALIEEGLAVPYAGGKKVW
ncbi:MAG: thermonuclease family protein [Solidesulfovibrio sp. DCME]|uniref:thermonuclease family protein n=1 Tax=Solidesulfovibrio sp. DCME TaxID=3447380 RepID=UPI003D0FA330